MRLEKLPKKHDFLVGIDSDGCVFDSMEKKMKECFCPAFIGHFGLQAVADYAREAWEFVSLYSKTRGYNRFRALPIALDLLIERAEVAGRGVKPPVLNDLRRWVATEPRLSNATLAEHIRTTGSDELARVMEWSLEINRAVQKIVHNLPPFRSARVCLQSIGVRADAIVVSQTPIDILQNEWSEHDMTNLVCCIAGQEMGSKSEYLQIAAEGGYEHGRMLMIGDAPGDYAAARSAGILFCPIVPGKEEQSWQRLIDEGLDRFFSGAYAGAYEAHLLAEFDRALPSNPPWKRNANER